MMKQTIILNCLIFFFQGLFAQRSQQNLSGKNWQFKELSNENWRPATVPGTIHTDLMDSKSLADPFWRDNEKRVQWVSNLDWVYKTEFELDTALQSKDHINLIFDGLDTYAEVSLNGKTLFKSENMFLKNQIDLKSLLKKGKNELIVVFTSPLKGALSNLLNNPQSLPATNDAMHLKTSPYTRKAGYSYGWDWGPRLVTSGIWRPVYLEAWNQTRIEDIFLFTKKIDGKTAIISGQVKLQNDLQGEFEFEIMIGNDKKSITILDSAKGKIHSFEIKVGGAELWWSNGLGKPFQYEVKAELSAKKVRLDKMGFKFGIRTIELIHEKDMDGKSFYFKLNGRPVFMKGANYIPQDNFLTRVGEARYLKTLLSAKNANMNMLRVWGGGIYENDVFYNLCDSLGILVWQDFMFACSMYPGTSKFQSLVKQEVRQNVQRLRNHASLAVWCGNNENETGWFKKWVMDGIPYSKKDSTKIYEDYKNLFHKIIPDIVKQEDPSRFYTRSSPSANNDEIKPDKIGYGDMHDWNVWFGTGDYRKYSKSVSRFQSEYGYQSFPAMESIMKFSESQDWFEDSDIMDVHQKHTNGNAKIRKYSAQFYQKPKNFESFSYISQLQQAEAMKFAIESHRSKMPYCMGSLYWQLNDCWPAASWSSVDYYGVWKATQYFSKKANEPIKLVAGFKKDSISVSIINEGLKPFPIQGIEVIWKDFNGKELSKQEVLLPNLKIADNKVWSMSFEQRKAKWSPTDSSSMYLQVRTINKSDFPRLEDILYLRLPKDLSLSESDFEKNIEKTSSGYVLRLKTKRLIKNIYLSSSKEQTHFSDNYFDLLPGDEKQVSFETISEVTLADINFKSLINE